MLVARTVASCVAVALALAVPAARAECAKATALRPSKRAGKTTRLLPPKALEVASRPGPRSPALVFGGFGVVLVGLAGLVVAAWASAPCNHDRGSEKGPCPEAVPLIYGGLVAGVGAVIGGSGMMYYGALDAPPSHNQSLNSFAWSAQPARLLSLRFRF